MLGAAFRREAGRRPRVIAHRGASHRAPENTLRAFTLALDDGADGVELDVRLAGTGELVVFHDVDLARITGAPGRVRETSLAELRARDAGGGERIPLLDEALDLVLSRSALVNVEVKTDDADPAIGSAVALALSRRNATERDRVIVSSFDRFAVATIATHAPELAVAFLFDDELADGVLSALAPHAVHPRATLVTRERVEAWHSLGLVVTTWTVDAASDVARVAGAGVDGIVTNDPRAALAAL